MDFQSHGNSRRSIPRRNRTETRLSGDIIGRNFQNRYIHYARIYDYVTNLNPKIHYRPPRGDTISAGVFDVCRYPSDRDRA